jgi:adenine-specific DNA methylase
LVLTDPPYYDNVQYGELSRLFHVWLSLYSSIPEITEQLEAVPNRVRGIGGEEYEDRIAECLKESRRTLKPDGRIILTFHNNNIRAWRALCGALMSCSLCIAAISIVRAENAADHSKRNRQVFLHDLLIECVPREQHSGRATAIAGVVETSEAKNLLAIGLAMSRSITECDVSILDALYVENLTILGDEDRRIR